MPRRASWDFERFKITHHEPMIPAITCRPDDSIRVDRRSENHQKTVNSGPLSLRSQRLAMADL
jgi:hypothetical protein